MSCRGRNRHNDFEEENAVDVTALSYTRVCTDFEDVKKAISQIKLNVDKEVRREIGHLEQEDCEASEDSVLRLTKIVLGKTCTYYAVLKEGSADQIDFKRSAAVNEENLDCDVTDYQLKKRSRSDEANDLALNKKKRALNQRSLEEAEEVQVEGGSEEESQVEEDAEQEKSAEAVEEEFHELASDESLENRADHKEQEEEPRPILTKKLRIETDDSVEENARLNKIENEATKKLPILMGGWAPCSQRQINLVSKAFEQFAQQGKITSVQVSAENVVSCEQQLVNGINVSAFVNIGEIKCRITFHSTFSNVIRTFNRRENHSDSNCLEHPALKAEEVPKGPIVGGWTAAPEEAKKLVPRVFAMLIAQGKIGGVVVYLENVLSVESQIVNGTNYKAIVTSNNRKCVIFFHVDLHNELSLLDESFRDENTENCVNTFSY